MADATIRRPSFTHLLSLSLSLSLSLACAVVIRDIKDHEQDIICEYVIDD
jgi:hypothetical protein